jgi:uncharacterized protein DUF1064
MARTPIEEIDVASLSAAQMETLLGTMQAGGTPKKRNPHTNAVKVVCDGHEFPSKAERDEYLYLRDRLARGEIRNLRLQPRFVILEAFHDPLDGRLYPALHYTPDFIFEEAPDWRTVVIEVKGRIFRDYPLRRHLFRERYPYIYFVEQRSRPRPGRSGKKKRG